MAAGGLVLDASEEGEVALIEGAGLPEAAASPRPHGRGMLAAALALAACAAAAAAFVSFRRGTFVAADPTKDLALYGEHMCAGCHGEECNCNWATAEMCSPQHFASECCWSCCCAQSGYHQFAPGPTPKIIVSPMEDGTYDRGCELEAGQVVQVTGNSGTRYHATIMGYSGGGMYQIGISGQTYAVTAERISECQPGNAFLMFWLPLVLGLALLGVVGFLIYKKVKDGKPAAAPAPPPPPARTCGWSGK
mmetsp:Transcript_5304/g.15586  ORF Transcript_5304/g.15586 Transcript_5304/m.15586 type:complete len:249 (+) Transcript_5304:72-818(+)